MKFMILDVGHCAKRLGTLVSAATLQDGFIMFEPEKLSLPKWVFNYVIGESCPYQWIPTKVVPPACIPHTAGNLPFALRVTGEPQSVALSSLRSGIFLTVKQIQCVMNAFHVEEPTSGSGKNNRVVKVDLATALINGLFAEASEEEKAFMVTSLLVRKQVCPEEAPELLVKLTSMLDTSEAQHFSRMRKAAVDELAVSAMKDKIAEKKASKEKKAEDDDGPAPSGKKRPLVKPDGDPELPKAKAPRKAEHEEKLRRSNVKAPREFLQFFPLVDHCYFKWLTKNFRVTVEFQDKDRFLTGHLFFALGPLGAPKCLSSKFGYVFI